MKGIIRNLVLAGAGMASFYAAIKAVFFSRKKDNSINPDLSDVLFHDNPLVSVVMATCNDCPAYIRESIQSILNQTYKNFELLIIDDSTNKAAIDTINSFCYDSRVHIFREEHKLGFTASLNKGLSLARGQYIARMDSDDVAALDRFEKQVRYFTFHPKTDIIGGQVHVIDEDGNVTGSRVYPLNGFKFALFFVLRTPVAHPSVMFRRSIADAGYRYDESLKKAEDIDFWVRLYNEGYQIENMSDILLNFRAESDFVKKRVINKEQENYVLAVRRRNFSMKRPVFSIANYLFSYVRQMTPDSFKVRMYQYENGRRENDYYKGTI